MRLLISIFFTTLATAAPTLSFHVMGEVPGPWPAVLSSIGLRENAAGDVLVIPSGAQISFQECQSRLDRGAILILEGPSPLAESFGFHVTEKPHVIVRSVEDLAADDRRRPGCAVRAGRAADHSGPAAAELTQVAGVRSFAPRANSIEA